MLRHSLSPPCSCNVSCTGNSTASSVHPFCRSWGVFLACHPANLACRMTRYPSLDTILPWTDQIAANTLLKTGEPSQHHTGSASQHEPWPTNEDEPAHPSLPHNPSLQQQLQQLQIQQQQQLHQLQKRQEQQLRQMYQQQAHSDGGDATPTASSIHDTSASRHQDSSTSSVYDSALFGQRQAPSSNNTSSSVYTSPLKRLVPHPLQPHYRAQPRSEPQVVGLDLLDADPTPATSSNHSYNLPPSLPSSTPASNERGRHSRRPTLEQEHFETLGEDVHSGSHHSAGEQRTTGGGFSDEACATPAGISLNNKPGFIAHGRRASGPFGQNQGSEGLSGGDSRGVCGVPGIRTVDRPVPGYWSMSGVETQGGATSDGFHGSPTKDGSRRVSLLAAEKLRGMRTGRSTTEYNVSIHSPHATTQASLAAYPSPPAAAAMMPAERNSAPGLHHAVQRGLTFPDDASADYTLSLPSRSFPDQQAGHAQQGSMASGHGGPQRPAVVIPHGRRSSIPISNSMPSSQSTTDDAVMLRQGSDPPGKITFATPGGDGVRGDDGGIPCWLLGTQGP